MHPEFFEIIPAPPEVRPFVRRFFYANRSLDAPMPMSPKPTGYLYFSNFFGPETQAVTYDVDGFSFHPGRWNMAGQLTNEQVEARAEGEIRVLFCELSPTSLHRLYGVGGNELTGRACEISELGSDHEDLLRDCFSADADGTRDEHVAEATEYFSRLIADADDADPHVEAAIDRFERENGLVRVADLCEELGISQRHFNRKFKSIVGLRPKFFGQLMQMNWALELLFFGDEAALADVAQTAGFFDQAHFVRAMRQFFSESPTEFLKSDDVGLRTFLATSRFAQLDAAPE